LAPNIVCIRIFLFEVFRVFLETERRLAAAAESLEKMCTICSHFSPQVRVDSSDIYDMLVKTEQRGPDTHGVYLDGNIVRANEIQDLKASFWNKSHIALERSTLRIAGQEKRTQPYSSCDGKLVLIHNGEIWNYQKLRPLLYKDHDIQTSSDSEIIIHLLGERF
jgi:asparagine synthase (glutamine-hydrolysing)